MIRISCGLEIAEEDYRALNQAERKRLGQLFREYRAKDKITPEKELREKAYCAVLAESVPFD
jgi:hypothetical protein